MIFITFVLLCIGCRSLSCVQVSAGDCERVSSAHGLNWTRQELGADEWDFLIILLLEVRMLMHPPLSGELPGSPSGSYCAEPSLE